MTVAAVVAFPLGVATCILLARAATAALAAVLASRRFRDLVWSGFALFGVVVGLGANLLGAFGAADPGRLRQALALIAQVAGWSPFGWAWVVPADVARGRWLAAGVHLLLAAVLVALLWRAWGHVLDVRLTSPIESGGPGPQGR